MLESYLQTKIKNALEQRGAFVIKTTPPPAGIPDLLVCCGDRHIWLEVKTKSGTLRKSQAAMHRQMQKKNQKVHVVRSAEEALEIYEHYTAYFTN